MWNLEKCYRWTYSQGGNRDTDAENGRVDWGWRKGTNRAVHWHTHAATCETGAVGSAGPQGKLSSGLGADLEGGVVGGRLGREGTYARMELTQAVVQQKPAQHRKAVILRFKTLKFKNKSLTMQKNNKPYRELWTLGDDV